MRISELVRSNLELQSNMMLLQASRANIWTIMWDFVNREPKEAGVTWVKPIGSEAQRMEYVRNTTAPVAVYEDFSAGGTNMQIPIKLTDKSRWLFGDSPKQGTGYDPKWAYKYLHINEIAKVRRTFSGHYSEQAYKKFLKQLSNARPELEDHLARYLAFAGICYTLHYGKSYELLLSSTSYGRGLTAVSHPNMYVAGVGWVAYDYASDTYSTLPGVSGGAYEGAVETAVNSLTDVSACHMSFALMDKMKVMLNKKRLMPTVKLGGKDFFVWIMTSQQIYQLQQDEMWEKLVTKILPRETDPSKNWLINAMTGIYNGFVIVENNQGWGVHTNTNVHGYVTAPTSGYPEYGPEDTGNDFAVAWNDDPSPRQTSFILGQRAIDVGIAKKPFFEVQDWDFKQKQEVAIFMVGGMERSSVWDYDNKLGNGVDAFVEDTGSICVVTYSSTPS